mmetsp:Transcript_18449/g.54194  ORF Transcript_18449/g.54194 Transcript_18449/m.54194 type:complete len:220 (+) Transcript_18449:570-1229(+)
MISLKASLREWARRVAIGTFSFISRPIKMRRKEWETWRVAMLWNLAQQDVLPHSCGYSEVQNQLVLLQPEEGSTSTSRCSGTMSGYTRQYRTSATHSRGLLRTTRTEPFFGKTSLNGPLSSRALRTLSPSHFQLPSRQLAHSPKKGIRVIRRPHLRSHPHRPRRRPALVAPSSQTNICRMASLVRALMRNLARDLVRSGIRRTVGRQGRRRVICRARSH